MLSVRQVKGKTQKTLFQSLGAKYKKDLPPAVNFDILGIVEIVADVEDYNAIRVRSSIEELSHSGLYK